MNTGFQTEKPNISKHYLLFCFFIFQQLAKNKTILTGQSPFLSLSVGSKVCKMFQVLAANGFLPIYQVIYEERTQYAMSYNSHLKHVLPHCSRHYWQLPVSPILNFDISLTLISSGSESLGKDVIFIRNGHQLISYADVKHRFQLKWTGLAGF